MRIHHLESPPSFKWLDGWRDEQSCSEMMWKARKALKRPARSWHIISISWMFPLPALTLRSADGLLGWLLSRNQVSWESGCHELGYGSLCIAFYLLAWMGKGSRGLFSTLQFTRSQSFLQVQQDPSESRAICTIETFFLNVLLLLLLLFNLNSDWHVSLIHHL